MEGFKKNIYLLTKEETKTALTLSEIAQLRKGQRFQSGVTFSQDMTDNDVRILLENLFSPILSNKRFSCATREGQTSAQFNFHGEHRVWDGRTIKRKVQGGSALYLVLEDEVEDKLVFNPVLPAIGTPSSLQGHLSSTSFCHNSKNSQTVSLTQTPQSATTVTSMNTANSTENAEETTPWEQDMCINDVRRLDDILSSLNFSDIGSENPLSPTGFGAIETLSEASFSASRSQEQNQLQNQIPSTSTDTFQSSDSAFSSSKDICFENLFSAIDFGAVETISGASFLTNRSQEQNQLQNQILSTSTDTFQSGDSAFSSSEETVSQNGIFSAQGTTQEGRMTKPIWLMENNCLPSDKSDFSGQSDSGISSEARVCLSQAPNPPIRIQEARIKPTDGPLEGGGLFSAEIDEELPRSMETAWAIFGNKSVKVRIARDGLALFGDKIPRGDVPGPVTVTFTTMDGERVAEATYTYKRRENPTTWQIKRALDGVEESVKRLRSVADSSYESYEFAAENYHESGIRERERERGSGDAPEPVTVTFTTLDGECEAKETYTYKKRENPTTWQITLVKRSLDEIEEYVKRLRRVAYTCCESDEFAAENYHESGGDAPEPVTVTFTTLDGECEAKATYSHKERENPTTWQITRVKRALDGVEESVKRLRSVADSCYDSDEFAAENYHESVVTQVLKAQLIEEGYFGDAEKSDIEDEDYDLMDNNENEIDEGESFVWLDPRHPLTETDVYERKRHEDIGKIWVDLVGESDFNKSVIDSIKSHHLSEKERCIDLSVQWMEKEGMDGTTASKWANVLTETGLKTLAENLLGPLNGRRKKVIEVTGAIRPSDNNELNSRVHELKELELLPFQRQTQIPSQELKNFVDASSHIAAETFENTGEMGSSTEKANNGFSEEEQRISSQLEDLQLKKLVIMKCLEMPELEETTLVSPWDLPELSLIPRTKIIILPGGAGNVKSFIGTSFLDLVCRRLWQNDISRLLWESEEDGLTEEKKRNLKTLVLFRNNRKNKVMLLEKPWIPLCSPELKNYVDASSHIAAETFENTGEMGSSTEKANNGFSEEEQRIYSQSEDLQRKLMDMVKCLEILELKNYVDASSHIAAETFENTGEMGSSTEKANNGFSEEEQRISSQLEDLQRNQLVTMKCLKMPELEKTALVSPWDLTELSLIPRTKIITLQGETGAGKSSMVAFLDLIPRRSWQNNISRLLRESEEDDLKTLVLFRNNRKNKVMVLEKPRIPLCSPVDELKKSQTFPSQRQTEIPCQKPRSNSEEARPKELITEEAIKIKFIRSPANKEDIGERWVDLVGESDFKKSVIDLIKNHYLTEKERCIDFLPPWIKKEGMYGTTAGKLANVLTETGLKTLAENLLGESFVLLDPRHPSTETDVYERRRHEDIGERWVDLVGESDFKKSVIDLIKNHYLSEKERCIDLSAPWMEKEGMDGTTAGKLANVLTETGLKTLAENLLAESVVSLDHPLTVPIDLVLRLPEVELARGSYVPLNPRPQLTKSNVYKLRPNAIIEQYKIFMSLDPRHPLTESNVYELRLHEDIGKSWTESARKLSVQNLVIDSLKSDNPSERERCIDLLFQGMEKQGRNGATAGKLANALTETGLKTRPKNYSVSARK